MCILCVKMMHLSPTFLSALDINSNISYFASEDTVWWLIDDNRIQNILTLYNIPYDKNKNIYDYRLELLNSNLLGEKIGIPDNSNDIESIEKIKIDNYYTIYLNEAPRLIA
jgi:hypothetical protein